MTIIKYLILIRSYKKVNRLVNLFFIGSVKVCMGCDLVTR